MNSDTLIDTFWYMTYHVVSIYVTTPLLVCRLKGVLGVSTIILDDFIFTFTSFLSFLHSVLSMVNDQFHCLQQNNNVKYCKITM